MLRIPFAIPFAILVEGNVCIHRDGIIRTSVQGRYIAPQPKSPVLHMSGCHFGIAEIG
jgi:hypothetical protein